MNSVDWTDGVDYWTGALTGTLEPRSVRAGYALYPCVTQLRRTLDSVSTWQKHGVITFLGVAYHSTHAQCRSGTTTPSLALERSVPYNHGRRHASGSDCN